MDLNKLLVPLVPGPCPWPLPTPATPRCRWQQCWHCSFIILFLPSR